MIFPIISLPEDPPRTQNQVRDPRGAIMNRQMIGLVLVFMLESAAGFAQGSKWDKHAPPARTIVACQTCHECSAPTKTNPCLSACPRANALPGFHPTNQGPEVLIMGKVSKEYGPVIFSHRLHADMSKMSGGCYGCHHYNSTSMTVLLLQGMPSGPAGTSGHQHARPERCVPPAVHGVPSPVEQGNGVHQLSSQERTGTELRRSPARSQTQGEIPSGASPSETRAV